MDSLRKTSRAFIESFNESSVSPKPSHHSPSAEDVASSPTPLPQREMGWARRSPRRSSNLKQLKLTSLFTRGKARGPGVVSSPPTDLGTSVLLGSSHPHPGQPLENTPPNVHVSIPPSASKGSISSPHPSAEMINYTLWYITREPNHPIALLPQAQFWWLRGPDNFGQSSQS